MTFVPTTVAECDVQLAEYRKMLAMMSSQSKTMVWDQIDALLDARSRIERTARFRARQAARLVPSG